MMCATAYNAANVVLLFVPVASAAVAFNWAYVVGCVVATAVLWGLFQEHSKRFEYDRKSDAHPATAIDAPAQV